MCDASFSLLIRICAVLLWVMLMMVLWWWWCCGGGDDGGGYPTRYNSFASSIIYMYGRLVCYYCEAILRDAKTQT